LPVHETMNTSDNTSFFMTLPLYDLHRGMYHEAIT
jgi:hypothetical protein